MSESTPIPAPYAGDVSALPPLPSAKVRSEKTARLVPLFGGLAASIVAFDACFWQVQVLGFSLAVFVIVLAGVILTSRNAQLRNPSLRLVLLLLAGALGATVIETGTTNSLVLLSLILVLTGETHFQGVASHWGRALSQIVALVRAPGRIFWLGGALLEASFAEGAGWMGGLFGGCLLALPAVFLALLFGSLLAEGNQVFGSWTNSFFSWLWREVELYLNASRMGLWCLVAFATLPLLRPVEVSDWWWSWTGRLPRFPGLVPARGAVFSSALILVTLNALFFVANFADLLFLWSKQTLPMDVDYSTYVHEGVNALIVTVVLSAGVLAVIFQQTLEVARRRELKALAYIWILQNLFLLVSVAFRLRLYIEAYNMTVLRLSVLLFLLLVAVGYGLLVLKIAADKSLSWLLGGCVLSVLATFYLAQFLNLAGWSAGYNVAQWEKNRSRPLDVNYLRALGPAAWPALRHASDLDPSGDAIVQWIGARNAEASAPHSAWDWTHWREFSLRAWLNHGAFDDKK